MQSVPAHLLNQVRDADSLQVPHGGQTTQVSPLLQDVRQRLLPVPAPAHPPGDQTLPLLLLRELLPSAVTPAAAHQVGPAVSTKRRGGGCVSVGVREACLQHVVSLVEVRKKSNILSNNFFDSLLLLQNPHWR